MQILLATRNSSTVLVKTLRESALLFVWDQLAMQYWDWRVLVDAALALLMQLKPRATLPCANTCAYPSASAEASSLVWFSLTLFFASNAFSSTSHQSSTVYMINFINGD